MIKLLSIADVISLINACFGFLAILILFSDIFLSHEIRIRLSFSFILLALLADGLDGIIARRTRTGELGEYLEAMADMISLGIAPSVFVYTMYHDVVSRCIYYQSYIVVVLIVFLSLSIIRLASFHIMKEEKFFVGLPASASTIFILILAFLEVEFIYMLLFIVIISFVMISNIRFPKPGLEVNSVASVLIILTIVLGKTYYNVAPLLLFSTLAFYTIVGPFYVGKKTS